MVVECIFKFRHLPHQFFKCRFFTVYHRRPHILIIIAPIINDLIGRK